MKSLILIAAGAACGLAAPALAQADIAAVYVSGDALPGGNGQTFGRAYDTSISTDGYIGFKSITQSGASADQGLYFGQIGSVELIAFEGEQAPGTAFPYRTFNAFDDVGPIRISGQGGFLSYVAQLEIPGQPDPMNVGVWSNRAGPIEKVALYNDPDPGSAGDTLNGFENLWIDNSGRSFFFAFGTAGSGLFADPSGTGDYQRLVFSGDAVPGLNPGETVNNFSFPHGNSVGQWMVLASLTGTGERVLVAGDFNTGQMGIVVRAGDPIVNSSQTVGSFNDVGDNQLINANGTIAFGHFGSGFSGGIVVGNMTTGLRTVGERNQPIGDTGLVFNSQLTAKPKLNNNDEVSFVGRITGAPASSDRVIIVTDSDLNPSILLREGDTVPGLTGVSFGSPPNQSSLPDHVFNDSGIVVAGMPLTGATSSSNFAVVYGTGADDLAVLVRTGDSFQVGGQDKVILSIDYTDALGPDGLPLALNGNDEFIFSMRFTDGSAGLFIADLTPEAGCVADVSGDGQVNFVDIVEFLGLFNGQDPAADLAAPFGSLDFGDVTAFLGAYNAGCP